jgi:hypothetical protein
MYSINVPVLKSIKLTHRSVNVSDDDNNNPKEYLIAEADYVSTLELLVDMCFAVIDWPTCLLIRA